MAKGEARSVDRCLAYCLRLLSISPRTEKEMLARLKAKGCDGAEVTRIVAFLKKQRFIDDLAFAREWIVSRMKSNPRGRDMLEHELKKKGIGERTIEEAFSGLGMDFDEKELASRLAIKKMGESEMRKSPNVKAKLWRYLAGKGFGEGAVEEVVGKILGNDEGGQ